MREAIGTASLGFFMILTMLSGLPETRRLPWEREDAADCDDCVIVQASQQVAAEGFPAGMC